MKTYQHLGVYSNLVDEAKRQRALFPLAAPGADTQAHIRDVLGFCEGEAAEQPQDVRVEQRWEKDGLIGEALSWSVGYGPRTQAWLLRPAQSSGPLPGIVALHDHGGFKYYGKEKIAIGPNDPPPVMTEYRAHYYGNHAYPNDLARAGHVVLIHDTFLWGSRRFPIEDIPQGIRELVNISRPLWQPPADSVCPIDVAEYNACVGHHEHLVEKYCNLLGTGMAGVVCHEDRIATNYLRSRPEVLADRVGCIGLSGGGNRAAMLLATHDGVKAAVIVGLMSTYEGLLDKNIISHTWMLFPRYLARYADWADLAACRAPAPLLVQYDEEDDLFTSQGMHDADVRIAAHYQTAGQPQAYRGEFYPGPHKFDADMQASALKWLKGNL